MNAESGPIKETKHNSCYRRIEQLENTIEKLVFLVDKVDGLEREPLKMNNAEVKSSPSLAGFLSEQPERLEKMITDLLTQIERLEKFLF